MYDVLGIGCHAIDFLCKLDSYPEEDTKLEVSDIEVQGGGNVATALVAVSRLGGSAVYHGVVANDAYRENVLSGLDREGIDTGFITTKEGKTPVAFIMINSMNSSRTIIYSIKGVPQFLPGDINRELFGKTRVLLTDFYYPAAALEAARIASGMGIPVVLDAEKPCALAGEIMAHADHIISSAGFARWYTGSTPDDPVEEMLRSFAGLQPAPCISITLGEAGVFHFERSAGTVYHQGSYRVDTTDTTGAGDVFHGVYALFLARGLPVKECLRLSAACSAMKCRSIGGRAGIPRMDALRDFLRSRGEEPPGE